MNYEDDLEDLINKFGELFNFEECELITDLGECNIFIHNYFIWILN